MALPLSQDGELPAQARLEARTGVGAATGAVMRHNELEHVEGELLEWDHGE